MKRLTDNSRRVIALLVVLTTVLSVIVTAAVPAINALGQNARDASDEATQPVITSTTVKEDGTVQLTFSTPMDKTRAENTEHYLLSGDGKVKSAALSEDGLTVTLALEGVNTSKSFPLCVVNLIDRTQAQNNIGSVSLTVDPGLYLSMDFEVNAAGESITGGAIARPVTGLENMPLAVSEKGHIGSSLNAGTPAMVSQIDYQFCEGHSISLWVSGKASEGTTVLFAKGDKVAGHFEVYSRSGQLYFYSPDLGDHNMGFNMNTLGDGWHNLVFSRKDDQLVTYADGQQVASIALKGTISEMTADFAVGALTENSLLFAASLDTVRLYDRLLSDAEIAEVSNPGLSFETSMLMLKPSETAPVTLSALDGVTYELTLKGESVTLKDGTLTAAAPGDSVLIARSKDGKYVAAMVIRVVEVFNWPDPEYREMETVEQDMHIGTLKYTPSADGKEMTISYEVAGETVSYTVPNQQNYLSGGYRGTDDLGRPLYSSEDVGAYAADERYIGLFYFLWHGEHGDAGIYDLQKIIDEVGIEAAGNESCGKYAAVGQMHWFAEPLYGYYYANDAWVMRKHVELLTNANIDFLYFDVTNGATYLNSALQLMGILHEFNEQGYDAPQVVFYTHSSADAVVKQLYTNIYNANKYPDTWFRIDGKPVIIAPDDIMINGSTSINDVFTVKREQWPNDPNLNENAWPWMDFEWPQRIFTDQEGKPSAVSVSIAQHSGTVRFTDSSLYDNFTNRGRSYVNEAGVAHTDRKYNQTLSKSYKAWKEDPNLTMYGLNFQAQFDYAIESEAQFILVTGWNEWVAQRQPGDDGQINFVDTASMEFSRDAEMMRGGYFDNYYMQLIYNVQKAKGTAPIVVQDSRKPINVTGEFDQWSDIVVEYKDSIGDTVDRNATGFGHKKLTNKSGRNDLVTSKVTSDTKNVYFYVQTVDTVTEFDTDSSWMQLYVNSDADASTGWYGYDYIVNYRAKDAFTTTVAKYNGKDNAFSFEEIGDISYRVKDNEMMLAIPLSMLGMDNYMEIEMEFKWADSKTTYDEMEDFYCDGDVAPLGRLNYVYQNYIEQKSTPPVEDTETESTLESETVSTPESDTEALVETLAETLPETPVATDSETQEETEAGDDKGCSSVVMTASGVALVTLAAVAYVLRKKD